MDTVCEACKTIPPVVDQDQYQEKGHYKDFDGIKCYVAAPTPTPKSGIIFIYDIFGYFKQTLQGADILALTDPGHVVVMPDFFFGKPYDLSKFPPKTDEEKAAFGSFFANEASFPKTTKAALGVLAEAKKKYPDVSKWGIFGLCWGGKAATVISLEAPDVISASGQAHPAMLDPADIGKLTIPHICLSSKDEDEKAAKAVIGILSDRTDGSHSTIYSESIHGWMGARSNLKVEAERKTFEQGYARIAEFFKQTLS